MKLQSKIITVHSAFFLLFAVYAAAVIVLNIISSRYDTVNSSLLQARARIAFVQRLHEGKFDEPQREELRTAMSNIGMDMQRAERAEMDRGHRGEIASIAATVEGITKDIGIVSNASVDDALVRFLAASDRLESLGAGTERAFAACRKLERDYFIRREQRYVDRFLTAVDRLAKSAPREKVLIERYRAAFSAVAEFDALRARSVSAVGGTLSQAAMRIDEVHALADTRTARMKSIFFWITIGAFILLLGFDIDMTLWVIRLTVSPLRNIMGVIRGVVTGNDLSGRIATKQRKDEIGALSSHINMLLDKMRKIVSSAQGHLEATEGERKNLESSVAVSVSTVQNMAGVIRAVEKSIDTQHAQVASASEDSEKLASLLERFRGIIVSVLEETSGLTASIESEVTSVTQISSSITEMSATLGTINTISTQADTSTKHLAEVSEEAKTKIDDTAEKMDELLQSTAVIGEFVTVIGTVAEQTNLLAMNAAIEAAHAGEHGKGFAVVAEEIRKLADLANQKANDAKASLALVEASINATATEMKATESNFAAVFAETEQVTNIITSVKNATDEEAIAAKEIVGAVTDISGLTGRIKENYTNINAALLQMRSSVDTLIQAAGKTAASIPALLTVSEEIRTGMGTMANGIGMIDEIGIELVKRAQETMKSMRALEADIGRYAVGKK
ncbi:MAG: HAMP domain-containing methyl-accepting chemotaxis protein [Spirochaetota bacterium]